MERRIAEGLERHEARKTVEKGGGGGDNGGMDDLAPRIAVLEHIAKDTAETLKGIQAELRDTSKEIQTELRDMRKDMNAEFKAIRQEGLKVAIWLLSAGVVAFGALFGLMAHGFKWIG
ncbi:hypothetical protein NBRC3293_2468 [Gluconobacter oxydans NBRC 3293]|uniref:DUF1640 domain-containing protein n=2 Tax=Gluconobacter oxydans TaxID=442 RepID=A0A829WYU9_GLUOY|nr:hypothetical protein NBRC3293_2468 [Gluconobacter oxydans NBRC 3293]